MRLSHISLFGQAIWPVLHWYQFLKKQDAFMLSMSAGAKLGHVAPVQKVCFFRNGKAFFFNIRCDLEWAVREVQVAD